MNTAILFSVIVPVYDDWHRIPQLLEALAQQQLAASEFEVLLVDNGSKNYDPPKQVADNVRTLHCPTPGSYAARNYALKQAQGVWLAFTDADCRPHPNWLACLQAHLQAHAQTPPYPLIAGAIEMYAEGEQPSHYQIYDLVRGIPQQRYVSRGYAATANLLINAQVLHDLQGFDASRFSGGDADCCRRAVAKGHALHFCHQAVVYHPARSSWRALVQKCRRIKGAQLTAGSRGQRLLWTIRTLLPPAIACWRFIQAKRWPWRYRLIAMLLQQALWAVELSELLRRLRFAPLQR